jgi:hypothetical protein
MRWVPMIIGYLVLGGWMVATHFDQILPNDPAERDALHECFLENHRFDPLNSGARDECLRTHLFQLATGRAVTRSTQSGPLSIAR